MTKKIYKTYLLSLASLIIIGVIASLNAKYFSSDGANYLFTLLSTGELYSYQEGRVAAHYILKTPTWLLITMGVKNFDLISFSMGFSFYLQMILGIVLSFKILSQKNKIYILYPIISTFLFSMNTEYAIESESLFLNSVFWPVFFYIYEFRRLDWNALLYLPLALALAFSYETFCLIALFIIFNIFKSNFIPLKAKITSTIFLLLLSALQLRNIIFHEYPDNVGRYIYSVKAGFFGLGSMGMNFFPYRNIYFVFVIFFSIFLLISAFSRTLQKSKYLFIFLLIGAACLVITYYYPTAVSRNSQFSTRSLTSIAPAIMSLIFFIGLRTRKVINYAFVSQGVTFIILFQSPLSLITTVHWKSFDRNLNIALKDKNGVVLLRDTLIRRKIESGEISTNYLFWSVPLYSIFLDKDKTIDALLYEKNYHSDMMNMLDQIKQHKATFEKYGFEMRVYEQ